MAKAIDFVDKAQDRNSISSYFIYVDTPHPINLTATEGWSGVTNLFVQEETKSIEFAIAYHWNGKIQLSLWTKFCLFYFCIYVYLV